jgi:hypothetical protein
MPGNRLGSQGRRAVRVGAVASTGQPPFLQRPLGVLLEVREAVAERHLLEERDDDRFLLCGQRGEARRVAIGGTERADQRFQGHSRIARMPEGIAEESRQIVAPRLRVEIPKPPEREALDVGVGRLIARRVERLGLVVAVHCASATEAQRRGRVRVGAKHLEGLAHDLVGRDGEPLRFGIVRLRLVSLRTGLRSR